MAAEFPWPRPGDVLFVDGDDWWHNACVGWSRDQWVGYAEGYRRAADVLVQHASDTRSDLDFLIYPIVFLYRQSLEVSLKHLLFEGSRLLDNKAIIWTRHPLVPLWQRCRAIIEQVWPEGPKQDLDAVGEVLHQFDDRDPGSTVFRYPVDTRGRVSLCGNERINIRNFAEVANRVFSLLEACAIGVSEYLQQKCEMERDSFC